LVSWLGRETSFPDGAVLLTGTGIVPPDDFTLAGDDEVVIEVTGIGRLASRGGGGFRSAGAEARRFSLTVIPSLSRIMTWKPSAATNCAGTWKRWSSPRWSGARRTAWKSCAAWKKRAAACFDSRRGRCIRPC